MLKNILTACEIFLNMIVYMYLYVCVSLSKPIFISVKQVKTFPLLSYFIIPSGHQASDIQQLVN